MFKHFKARLEKEEGRMIEEVLRLEEGRKYSQTNWVSIVIWAGIIVALSIVWYFSNMNQL